MRLDACRTGSACNGLRQPPDKLCCHTDGRHGTGRHRSQRSHWILHSQYQPPSKPVTDIHTLLRPTSCQRCIKSRPAHRMLSQPYRNARCSRAEQRKRHFGRRNDNCRSTETKRLSMCSLREMASGRPPFVPAASARI